MAYKVLSPESEQLTFICGLGWPEVSRYYLSSRSQGMWEFWEQPPGSSQARMVFGWLGEGSPPEAEVAKRMLDDYLGTFKEATLPKGDMVQGLLSIREIRRVLRKHDARSESSLLRFPIRPTSTDTTAA
jgi:hypothetical protein